MKRFWLVVFFFLVFCPAFSQQENEQISHYLFPEFTKGSILMNNGQKYDVLLNYNTLTEEMIMEIDSTKTAIARTDVGFIDTVYIEGKKLISRQGIFIELLHQSGYELFAEHRCGLKEIGKSIGYGQRSRTTAITNYSSFSGWDRAYDLKLPEVYEIQPEIIYWLKKNDDFNRISSILELKKIYKKQKKEIKEFRKQEKLKFDDPETLIRVLDFLESNAQN